jgi:hypothetical protein
MSFATIDIPLSVLTRPGRPHTALGEASVSLRSASSSEGSLSLSTRRFQLSGVTTCSVRDIPCPGKSCLLQIVIESDFYSTVSFVQRLFPGRQSSSAKLLLVDEGRVDEIEAGEIPRTLLDILNESSLILSEGEDELSGEQLFYALPVKHRAALMNIHAKASHESTGNQWKYIREIVEVREDRLYAKVDADLVEYFSLRSNELYTHADDSQHEDWGDYQKQISFKTVLDTAAGLQLVIMKNRNDAKDFLVEFDIDESIGFAHILEAVRNTITFSKTNPFLIQQLLLAGGKNGNASIDPGYDLVFG